MKQKFLLLIVVILLKLNLFCAVNREQEEFVETTINSLIENLETNPLSIFALDENLDKRQVDNYYKEVEKIIKDIVYNATATTFQRLHETQINLLISKFINNKKYGSVVEKVAGEIESYQEKKLHENLVIVRKPKERQSRLEEIHEDDEEQDYADPTSKKTFEYSNSFNKRRENHFNFDYEGSSSGPQGYSELQTQPGMEQGVDEDEAWCGFDSLNLSSELQTHPDKGKGVEGKEDWYSVNPLGSSSMFQAHPNEEECEGEEDWSDADDYN